MFDTVTPMIEKAESAARSLRTAADNAARALSARHEGMVIRDTEKDAAADFAEQMVEIVKRLNAHRKVGF